MGANKYSVERPNATSLMGLKTPKDGLFDNRIFLFSYLIISPPGRPINRFKSVREFLETCRDSIKAHRSLYYDGKILHRDISENNIIVMDAEGERDPRGMLIDLDLGKGDLIHIDTILSHSSTSFCGSLSATARKRIRLYRK
jgi:hypothetical protein